MNSSREALTHPERGIIALFCGPMLLATVSLFLADFGWFSGWGIGLAILLWGLGGLFFYRSRPKDVDAGDKSFTGWPLVLLLLLASVLFTPPFQYLHGGWDPGEYPNTANQIAREGSLITHDPLVKTLSFDEKQGLMHHWQDRRTTLQPGYLWTDLDSDRITPDYYHLYPAWLAVFSELLGYERVYWGQTIIALYALLAFYLFAGSVFNRATGFWAALFLISSPATLFFARFTSSEFLSLFLIFTMLWAFSRHMKSRHPAYYCTGAWAAGLSLLCHGINLLCLAPMGAFLLFRAVYKPQKHRWWALALFVTFVGLALIRNFWHARIMSEFLISFFFKYSAFSILAGIFCSIAFCVASMNLRRVTFPKQWGGKAQWGVAIILTLLGLYSYFIRPEPGGSHDSYNFLLLSWQVSAPFLILAVCYFYLEKWQANASAKAMLFIVCGLPFALLLVNKSIQPLVMWCIRRYMPVLIPVALLLAAATVVYLWSTRKRWLQGVTVLFVLSGLGLNAYRALPMLRITDFEGLPKNLATLAEQLEDADFILFDHPYYSTPMARTFNLPAYQYTEISRKYLINRSFGAWSVLTQKAKRGEVAYWVSSVPHTQFFGEGFHMTLVGEYNEEYSLIKRIRMGMPRQSEKKSGHLWIYKLEPSTNNFRYKPQKFVLDVGNSTLGMHEGWGKQVPRREKKVRWTLEESSIYVPSFKGVGTEYVFHLNAARKGGGEPIPVKVFLDDREVGALKVSNGWKEYIVTVPAHLTEVVTPRLTIQSETWNPADFGIKGFNEKLGVMVDKITIQPLQQ